MVAIGIRPASVHPRAFDDAIWRVWTHRRNRIKNLVGPLQVFRVKQTTHGHHRAMHILHVR